MEKKLTRRESRETAFLTAFAATFEPEEPTVPAEEHAAPDAFANQLLAALALLAVATWLGNVGKNNKMFLLPMGFMIVVTICSLALTVKNQVGMIMAGGADWGPWAQTILGILLIFLAIILVIEGVQTLSRQKAAKA